LKFLRKIHVCEVPVLYFWKFYEKIEKLLPRVTFSLFDFALRRPSEQKRAPRSQKKLVRVAWGARKGVQKCS